MASFPGKPDEIDFTVPGIKPTERKGWFFPGLRGAPRVVRGGSWLDWAGILRCAFRSRFEPGRRLLNLGFRVVCRGSRQPWLVGS